MRILIAHNQYQHPGGEDAVVESEYALLKEFGEDARLYKRSNNELCAYNFLQKSRFILDVAWSRQSYQAMKVVLKEFRPDIVHFHNIFFMLSPSVYDACRDQNVTVVQSLHNFRLRCANGLFFRDNHICEDCLSGSPWQAVAHRCYKNSRLISGLMAGILQKTWNNGTWGQKVDCYIMATEFGRQKYIQAGIPPDKIVVKPNFVRLSTLKPHQHKGYALYVGRLSPEKGLRLLLEAWQSLPDIPLKIMGSGPLSDELKHFVHMHNMRQVEFLGFLPEAQYTEYMQGAQFIVVPSLCYENFPRIIAEGYAFGIPILASSLGTMKDLVKDYETGLLFNPAEIEDLKKKAHWLATHHQEWIRMSQKARLEYEQKYSAQKNYEFLSNIYKRAIEMKRKGCQV